MIREISGVFVDHPLFTAVVFWLLGIAMGALGAITYSIFTGCPII